MKSPIQLKEFRPWTRTVRDQKILELGLSLLLGLLFGILVIIPPYLPLPSDFQKLVYFIPFVFVVVILFKDLEKLILFALAISIPLNLDVSVIISDYARNAENIGRGYRTLTALTELRVSLLTITLLIGYAVWLLRPKGTEIKRVRFFASTTIPALGFIFISGLSIIQAQDTQLWLFRIVLLVQVFLAYFYLANHLQTTQDLQFFLVVSLGGLLAESVLMIVQWVTGLTFQFAGLEAMMLGPGRVGGTLGHTGPAGNYLSALALIACAMMWGFSRKSQKVMAAASMGLGVVALVSTGSRIGWIGFAVTILAFVVAGLFFGWVRRETLILLSIILLILGAVFFGGIYTRFTANDNGSADARPMMWRLAWNVIRAHPWLGIGAGNYALVTRDYYTPDVGIPDEVLDIQVHNLYLGIWAESGIFALLCYLGMVAVAILKAWSCANSHSRFYSLLGIGLSLAIVSLCIQMLTGVFYMLPMTLFLWLMVAVAARLPYLEQAHRNPIIEA